MTLSKLPIVIKSVPEAIWSKIQNGHRINKFANLSSKVTSYHNSPNSLVAKWAILTRRGFVVFTNFYD